jgi:hypothetical protein
MPTPAEGQPVEKLEINFSTFSSADRSIDRPTDRQPLRFLCSRAATALEDDEDDLSS